MAVCIIRKRKDDEIMQTGQREIRNVRIKSHSDVKKYIKELRDGSPERKQQAKAALIKTGVLSKHGRRKERIVNWE